MYNDIGTNLCAGDAVGTAGYEDIDMQTYKEWGVDFIKVDNCYYLWDNATFSNSANAQYVYAPKIRSKTVSGNDGFALNQDAFGIQAKRIYSSVLTSAPDTTYTENNNRVDILAKPLANGDIVLTFVNISQNADPGSYSVSVDEIVSFIGAKMTNGEEFKNAFGYIVKNLWTKEISNNSDGVFTVNGLDGCESVTIRISPQSR